MDDDYNSLISENIVQWKTDFNYMDNKNMLWEIIKYKIRELTIKYSKRKAKQKKAEEVNLKNKLSEVEKKLGDKNTDNVWVEYEEIKAKLLTINNNKINGHIIRSRVKWSEQNETNSAYFFGLEKNNFSRKNINKLENEDGNELSDPHDILNHIKSFYKRIYASKKLDIDKRKTFLTNIDIPQISQEEYEACEKELSIIELESVMKLFKENKNLVMMVLLLSFIRNFGHY